jgi:Plasmid pRiA4b ORF-3-like protein
MIYLYDFGDNWRHEVVLEKTLPSDPAVIRHDGRLFARRRPHDARVIGRIPNARTLPKTGDMQGCSCGEKQ